MSTLVLITDSYPFEMSKENSFLNTELPYLQTEFKRIIIVPCRRGGMINFLPKGIELDISFALESNSLKSRIRIGFAAVTFPLFWKDLFRRLKTLVQPGALSYLLSVAGINHRMYWWMKKFIRREAINLDTSLFYTYWLGAATLGIGLLKNDFTNIKVISRAHRFDIYEYCHTPSYIPLQTDCLKHLDRIFSISEDGKRYISKHFPWFADSCEVARLGVHAPSGASRFFSEDVFRISSCSFLTPVKRIHLLMYALMDLALNHPDQSFEWYHIGDGPLLSNLMNLAKTAPDNIKLQFLGRITNDTVQEIYRKKSIHLFVNVSSSEGIPVSIMEAMSCGIPIIATSVGGISEIVSEVNGFLLPSDPSVAQISEAIWKILNDSESLEQKRKGSLMVWQDQYNADINLKTFAKKIRSLLL